MPQNQVSSLFPFSQPQYQPGASPFESLLNPFSFGVPQPQMAPQTAAPPAQMPQDPASMLIQLYMDRFKNPSETRGSSGQPGRRIGVGGGEITAADPTGSGAGAGFFSTPEQVQQNLASGKTINSMSPALMAYNQQNAAGVPQSFVVPTAQPNFQGGLSMEGPYGVGQSYVQQPTAPVSPQFQQAMQLKHQQNPFAFFASNQRR